MFTYLKKKFFPIKLIMTLLVKNEEEIIEENLIFHKAMGIDGFIVTDNKSTDKTRKILKKYQRKGWILEIIDEPSQNYNQYKWVNRMIKLAKKKFKANWIINCDADEFWYPKSGNLKNEIYKTKGNVLQCFWHNMVPQKNNKKFWENIYSVAKNIENAKKYKLSKWHLYDFLYPKVMHSTKKFKSIEMGNHDVNMKRKKVEKNLDVIIYHFSIQNYKHFEQKIITGGKAYERNTKLDKTVGAHWRYWYECFKKDILHEEYNKIIGKEYFKEFLRKKVLVEDKTIFNFFKQIKKNTK